jgi:WhiB family transcriptional regulator, redox-sensing transcriptional regulator
MDTTHAVHVSRVSRGRVPRMSTRIGADLASITAVADEPWSKLGVCMTTDPDLFFPDKGVNVVEAKKVCAGCPVVVECASYAVRADERYGVWGGLSERDRRPYVRAAKAER